MTEPCALCSIPDREASRVVYRDAHVYVCLIFEPLKEGHCMVLPVRHAERLADLTPEEAAAFLRASDRAADVLTGLYGEPSGFYVNGWSHRSQPHLHAHVWPTKVDLRDLVAAAEGVPRRLRVEPTLLEAVADRLRPHFAAAMETR